jgi:hypothetical protein
MRSGREDRNANRVEEARNTAGGRSGGNKQGVGHFTHSRHMTTPHPNYDESGNPKSDGGSKYAGPDDVGNDYTPSRKVKDVDRASAMADDKINDPNAWDGLVSKAPKR